MSIEERIERIERTLDAILARDNCYGKLLNFDDAYRIWEADITLLKPERGIHEYLPVRPWSS
ncbi:MAG: hypothetical protein KGL39_22065 [Patescibacteria group bacterium]|nr:hypothetical protein [Patescibacteria group bacterium]